MLVCARVRVSEGRRWAPEQRATAVRAEARHSFAHVRSGALAGMGAGGGSTRGRGEMAATAAASAAAKSGDVVLAVGGADGADSGGRLAWRNVTYAVTSKKKDGERRVLLDNLSGSVERGELLAILGPSGAGKSSLLNALAGRVPTSNEYECELTGEISLGGRPCDAEDIVKVSAYVEQEDALFALSTCEETLLFAAALRLPQGTPTAELRARVDEVINELGLVKARHTPVGGNVPGAERGLSGGERKRLNIGIDLLHRPNLIFVDEPTSGLDSFQALNVMGTLIELSRHDRTVVCSVHQPRSSIYASLDKVLLLSQGRQVFLGGANDAADFFERVLGHALPPNYNPADFFLDTISMDYRSPGAQAQSEARLAGIFKVLDGLAAEGKEAVEAPVSAEGDDRAPEQTVLQGAFWTSFWLLLCRTWREQTRNKLALGIKLGMNIFFSIIFGLVYLRMPNSQQSIQDRTGLLFFSAMNAAFGAPIGVSQVIPRELKVVQRERASGMYSVISYYLAVFFASLPLELIPGLASASVMYFMAGLRPGAGYFAMYVK